MNEGNFQARRGPLPPAYLLAAILSMTVLLHLPAPGSQLLPVAWRLAGAIAVAAGVLLNVWAEQPIRGRSNAGTYV